jgi:hypothetical protein
LELMECFKERKHLDISYCGLSPRELAAVVFPVLTEPSCHLETLLIKGCPAPGRELSSMLKHNKSLKHLYLNHPSVADAATAKQIVEGLASNETLHTLAVYNKLVHRAPNKNKNNDNNKETATSLAQRE